MKKILLTIINSLFPPQMRFIWLGVIASAFFFLILRIVFALIFYRDFAALPFKGIFAALIMGLRFDLRLSLVVFLPIFFLSLIPLLSPWKNHNHWLLRFWSVYFSLAICFVLIIYVFDIGNYAWLKKRINYQTLVLATDINEALSVIWNSYPVIKISLGLIFVTAFSYWLFSNSLGNSQNNIAQFISNRKIINICLGIASFIINFCLIAILIHGAPWRAYSLRWSDVIYLQQPSLIQLSLNPIQNIIDTEKFKNSGYELEKVKVNYPIAKELLNLPSNPNNIENLSFYRKITFPEDHKKFNVIVVLLESFASYKTGLSGNPLNPSPNLDKFAREGIYFPNTYTAYENTARGVFALLTGIPDTENSDFSTRNPQIADQQVFPNEFSGYEKFYIMGGDPSWANIRALLANINHLHLFDMFNLQKELIGAWGVPDHELMISADKFFAEATKSGKNFVAIIQTASHHEPHLVPESARAEMALTIHDIKELNRYGFSSMEEFASFVYTDYAIGKLIAGAKKSNYFENTIFAFIGDHGVAGYAGDHASEKLLKPNLKLELRSVPWIIYAPVIIKPQIINKPVQQIDVFPTLMSLAKISHRLTTFGRNVLDEKNPGYAFTFTPDPIPEIGVMNENYYYLGRSDNSAGRLYEMNTKGIPEAGIKNSKEQKKLQLIANAIYQTSRYMLFNNKKLP